MVFYDCQYFFVTAIITLLSEKVVEPSLGKYEGGNHLDEDEDSLKGRLKISKQEKIGLIYAAISIIITAAGIALLVLPEGAILRNPETGLVANSPFLKSIVFLIVIFFAVPGLQLSPLKVPRM